MKKKIGLCLCGVSLFSASFFATDALLEKISTEDKLLQQYYEVEGGSIYTDHKGGTYFVENQDIEWLLVEVNEDGEVLNIK